MAQFETKGRFDGFIMKHTYTDGDDAATESKVIDEATGQVIAESSGSGGGGDFTTAEVTLKYIDDPGKLVTIIAAAFITDGDISLSIGALGASSDSDISATLILYKGKASLQTADAEFVFSAAESSGDIEISEDGASALVTGPCIITVVPYAA